MQNRVFVLSSSHNPLMPCHPARARYLMKNGKAAVFRQYPFTIILKSETEKNVQPITVKIDPGSKTTGFAVVATFQKGDRLVWAAELTHRGMAIKSSLDSRRSARQARRTRKTRYRQPRFLNRTKPEGWLAPSIESRIYNVLTWVKRIQKFSPVTELSVEVVKFDTQLIQNPEISGIEYQQGTLQGYTVREYILEKWGRKCAYCHKKDIPLQIEHMIPKSRGGSNQPSNLTLACEKCNQKKGTLTAIEFGYPNLMQEGKRPLKDISAVNSTSKELLKRLKLIFLPIEVGSGAMTKFNRSKQAYPKSHFIDAACNGESGHRVYLNVHHIALLITSIGHGNRQMCGTDKYGFPNRHKPREKSYKGFQTGDIVKANVLKGKYMGKYIGRVSIRHRSDFVLKTSTQKFDINLKYLIKIHQNDGYNYN